MNRDPMISLFINKLDPHVKLFWVLGGLGLTVWGIYHDTLIPLCALLVLMGTICVLLQASFGRILLILKVSAVIGIQLIVLQGFFHQVGAVMLSVGPVKLYSGRILLGFRNILTLLCLMLLFVQFFISTHPGEIRQLLEKWRVPGKYAILVELSVRFIPLLKHDLKSIYESQASRGLELTGFFQKVRGLPPIMIPLILRSLRRAEKIAFAMELKGFALHPQTTSLHKLRFTDSDRWGMLGAVLLYGGFVLFFLSIG
jgi:energy-coupling factor transport system permease protein